MAWCCQTISQASLSPGHHEQHDCTGSLCGNSTLCLHVVPWFKPSPPVRGKREWPRDGPGVCTHASTIAPRTSRSSGSWSPSDGIARTCSRRGNAMPARGRPAWATVRERRSSASSESRGPPKRRPYRASRWRELGSRSEQTTLYENVAPMPQMEVGKDSSSSQVSMTRHRGHEQRSA